MYADRPSPYNSPDIGGAAAATVDWFHDTPLEKTAVVKRPRRKFVHGGGRCPAAS
jgi:hypothetical protein